MSQLIVCIIIFAVSLVLYAVNVIPMALTSVLTLMAFVLTGCLTPEKALSCFSNSTLIIYGSMYVLAAGLNRTRFTGALSGWIVKLSGGSMNRAWLGYVLLAALLTSLIPSPPSAFAIMAPLCMATCKAFGEKPEKYMFALGVVCIGCCYTLPFGSSISQALLSNSFFEIYGLGQYAMKVTDPIVGRWPFAVVLILWAWLIAPRHKGTTTQLPLKVPEVKAQTPLPLFSEIMGVAIFALVILLMVFASPLGLQPWQVSLAGAAAMVLCGVLKDKEAYAAIPLALLFTVIGALATGIALADTGAGDVIGKALASLLGGIRNNYVFGGVLFAASYLLTHVMLNSGVTALFRPVVLMVCVATGANPVGPMILLMSSALTVYISPLATPVIPMVQETGGYTGKALISRGAVISLVLAAVQVIYVMTVFPAF